MARARVSTLAAWLMAAALTCVLAQGCGSEFESSSSGRDAGQDANATCIPTTCDKLGAECGAAPDGCGDAVQCGTCPGEEICGGDGPNRCGSTPCTPTTCAAEGIECGVIGDRCGSTLSCGGCEPPESCGGGGTPNACGCTPGTCSSLNKNCGMVDDGCGGTLSCGSCADPDTCGGGGTPNVCGCAPATCQSTWCGAVQDACTGKLVLCPAACGGGQDCNLVTHECVSCVVGVCQVSAGKCIVSSPCDGNNHIPLYCPCPAGKSCNLGSGLCV